MVPQKRRHFEFNKSRRDLHSNFSFLIHSRSLPFFPKRKNAMPKGMAFLRPRFCAYPFTEPITRPVVKYFCTKGYTTRIGTRPRNSWDARPVCSFMRCRSV